MKMIENTKLTLASGSPRRRELMAAMGLEFRVVSVDADESFPVSMAAGDVPLFLARKKSDAYTLTDDETVITSDTVVILDGEILGKPANRSEAITMLSRLSGRMHTVITGVCIRSQSRTEAFASTTTVTFRPLTHDEIIYYVDNFKPFDKAGAYGIQEWIGHVGITKIDGSYNNVVGLPTEELFVHLRDFYEQVS